MMLHDSNALLIIRSWPFYITADWDSDSDGYRAQRILDVLTSKDKVRVGVIVINRFMW